MGPETSMEIQAALGSDIALAFDECTPFHVDRDYTRRSMERTHRWLDRCVAWHGEHAPEGQALYGIVQGGVEEDLRAESAAYVAGAGMARDRDRRLARAGEGADARGARLVAARPARRAAAPPARIGDVDDIVHAVGEGIDTFDCATPTRLARHGTALVPSSEIAGGWT